MIKRGLIALILVAALPGFGADKLPPKKPKTNFFTADNGMGGYFAARLVKLSVEAALGIVPPWTGFDLGGGGPQITGAPDYSGNCAGANLNGLAAALNDAQPPSDKTGGLIRLDQASSSEAPAAFDMKAIYQPGQAFSCSARLAPSP